MNCRKLWLNLVLLALLASFSSTCAAKPTAGEVKPTAGEVKGILVDTIAGQPVVGMELELMVAEKTSTGIDFQFGESNPHTKTDNLGAFVFNDVPPGSYGLGTSSPFGSFPLMTNELAAIIFDVTAGEITDLGSISVKTQ